MITCTAQHYLRWFNPEVSWFGWFMSRKHSFLKASLQI